MFSIFKKPSGPSHAHEHAGHSGVHAHEPDVPVADHDEPSVSRGAAAAQGNDHTHA